METEHLKHFPLKIGLFTYIMEKNFSSADFGGKVIDFMRKYSKNGQLESLVCNCCGKKLVVKDGIVREGVMMIDHVWDYFSEKDGEVHHFDLCESCYEEITSQFCIEADVEEQTELL